MQFSIFDLSFSYISRFYDTEPSKDEKMQIVIDFQTLLGNGWTVKDITKAIRAFIAAHPGEVPDIHRLFSRLQRSETNLIVPNMFYYHNELRIYPPAPRRDIDYNTGQITRIDEPWFLEFQASYTVDQLTEYFLSRFRMTQNNHLRKKYNGGFHYLLKHYTIDLVLFMIDAAANNTFTEDGNLDDYSVLKLADWKLEAEQALNLKRTESKVAGDDKIVPRKRVFTFGSRSTI